MKAPIIMLLLLLLLSGCGWTSEEAMKKAIEVCEPHGGVKYLHGSAHASDFDVECKNGVRIKGTAP